MKPYTHRVDQLGIVLFAAFLVGLLFGSFLNVCISRLPQHESVVHPRSRCLQCGVPIRWYDNIPLLSWVILRGRCRDCGQPISWRYFLVELATGLWFAVVTLEVTSSSSIGQYVQLSSEWWAVHILTGIGLAIVGFLLIGLMVMDWQTMILPDSFTLGGIAIALFLVCTQALFLGPNEDEVVLTKHHIQLTSPGGVVDRGNLFFTGPESLIFGRIAAVCGAALLLLLIRWLYKAVRHRDGMGLGDVKLLAMIAAFLGFWPAILSLFLGTLAAAVYGAALLARGKAGATSRLAFGSFLSIGGLVSALFGNYLINMYIALLR
ncbi:prepilin peptidase [Tunturiibacter gelidoferens]|uniref:Prepilin peptidase n=1 Tax=Tunturiibacter gelidiferens TaxID=3069689 RepID=A0AAU7Z7Y4_9BACT|nr:A24 family peptidase [Edaphobacter lichenicola]